MTRPFTYDRRHAYFAEQDVAPDHRYALMRYAGQLTIMDDITAAFDRVTKHAPKIKWRTRPDRKRQKRSHRYG